VVWFSLKNT